jgi:tetratricopeptide (TPR) repeat protein
MVNQDSKRKLARAMEAVNRTDFPGAIEILSDLLGEDGENAEAWCQLGVCYLETTQFDFALEALTRAVKHDPDHATAHYLLGNTYGTMGQLERASACYRRALEVEPQHGKAEEFLIRTEALLESREHYRQGLKLLYSADPSSPELNRALRELTQSVAIFDGSPARDNLLECARKLFDLKTEVTVAIEITAPLEKWASACARGYLCLWFKNWVGARAAYEEALGYRALDAFVHHALGHSFVELGDTGDCVRAWLRVLEIDPNYDFTQFGRVKVGRRGSPSVV